MSANWIAIALMPLGFFLIVVLECSRLHCARVVQRRLVGRRASAVDDPATGTPLR